MKLKPKFNSFFWTGISWLIILFAAYFIRVPVSISESAIYYRQLLGVLIFSSPVVLTIYIFIGIILIYQGTNFNSKK